MNTAEGYRTTTAEGYREAGLEVSGATRPSRKRGDGAERIPARTARGAERSANVFPAYRMRSMKSDSAG